MKISRQLRNILYCVGNIACCKNHYYRKMMKKILKKILKKMLKKIILKKMLKIL